MIFQLAAILAVNALVASAHPTTTHNCLGDLVGPAAGVDGLSRRADGVHFGYEGEVGSAYWSTLDPSFALCGTGKKQSPINFEGLNYRASPPTFGWATTTNASFANEGSLTVKVTMPTDASFVTYNSKKYVLKQFHFHTPSEHHFESRAHAAEMHFVHIAPSDNSILVVGVPLEPDSLTPNPFIANLLKYIPVEAGSSSAIPKIDFRLLISKLQNIAFNTYEGSLTTPPCTEGLRWFVATEPLGITWAQFEKFNAAIKFSARSTQPLFGR